MQAGRISLTLTALVEACLALNGCGCPTPDRSARAPLKAPPPSSSATTWSDVCDAACAPGTTHGACEISVRSAREGELPSASVSCVTPDRRGFFGAPVGDWQAVCDDRCGFSDWQQCTLDPEKETAHCFRPGCTGGAGRRPRGFRPGRPVASCEVGTHFAKMAELEAVSVVSFRRLVRDLSRLGAPGDLLARARAAQRDEIGHAARIGSLAHRFGGRYTRSGKIPRHRKSTLRSLALENAREGCVFETFGVMLAIVEAKAASDPRVRSDLSAIAQDEARHAELSWDIAHWAERRLDRQGRIEVEEERSRALSVLLASSSATPTSARLQLVAGVPSNALLAQLTTLFASTALRNMGDANVGRDMNMDGSCDS